MIGVQYSQQGNEDGLPYIRAVDNQQFYCRQNPVSSAFTKVGAAATTIPVSSYPAPTVSSSTMSSSDPLERKLGFNKKYLLSWYNGIPRLILIIALAGCWISAATIKNSNNFQTAGLVPGMVPLTPMVASSSFNDFESTRLAFLVIALIAFFVSLITMLMVTFNVHKLRLLKFLNWVFAFAILDMIFFVAILIMSIVSAVRETQLSTQRIVINNIDLRNYYNQGAFAAAAFFGFLSCIIYLILITAWAILFKRKRRQNNDLTKPTINNIEPINNFPVIKQHMSDGLDKTRYNIKETTIKSERQLSEVI